MGVIVGDEVFDPQSGIRVRVGQASEIPDEPRLMTLHEGLKGGDVSAGRGSHEGAIGVQERGSDSGI